jgi:PKHD-type hydroxylase
MTVKRGGAGLIVLADVLSRQEVLAIRDGLAVAPFRDGRVTAGPAAERVKSNEQARGDDPGVLALGRTVRLALETHHVVRTLVRPVRWSSLMFSRYRPGQQYGMHADNAAMYDVGGWPLRTDVSFTLFLSDTTTYEGGALLLRDLAEDREFRPEAGSAVLYQTGQLHRVTPVTSGVRLACVGWVQSLVRRPDQREILFDLEQVRKGLGPDDSSLLLDKTIGNLLRMWGEG